MTMQQITEQFPKLTAKELRALRALLDVEIERRASAARAIREAAKKGAK